MDVPPDELAAEVAYQIGALEVFARAAGAAVAYVKPHGALYNRVVHDEEQAAAVVAGVRLAGRRCPSWGCPARGCWRPRRRRGCGTVREAFADRAYTAAGTLVPRREPGAVVERRRTRSWRGRCGMAAGRRGDGADRGARWRSRARSLCVHGDTPGAARLGGAGAAGDRSATARVPDHRRGPARGWCAASAGAVP